MSKAAELIAGLQADAEFDSAGGFSLDREKAREKMRQFQLADPHRYVLLLVECAVLRGASQIEFEIDADDMIMSFDAALEWEDLDELYTSLFIDRSGAGIRARRELALACNAVMALNPSFVEIVSHGPKGGVRARLRPDQPDEVERIDDAPAAGEQAPPNTRIHVRERFRPGLLVRFLRDRQGTIAEEQALRQRCATASTRILLDGKPISFGLPPGLHASVPFEAEDLRGVAGIELDSLDSKVVLLSNGVEVARHELAESVPGLWFWVDGSCLRKDVSQNDIVRGDPSYAAMLKAIAAARDQVLGKLAKAWLAGEYGEDSKPTANEVFRLLSRCFMKWADANWLRVDAGPLGALAELPLWFTTDRRWFDSRSLATSRDPERGLMFSTQDHEQVVPEGWGPVIFADPRVCPVEAIKRVYPDAHDVTEELARKVPAEQARRRWRGRPHEPRLPRGEWPVRLPLDAGDIRGELSLRPHRRSDLRVIVDGCLLTDLELDTPIPGLAIVLEGPFTPLSDYSRPRLDSDYARGLLAVLAQVPVLLAHWAFVQGEAARPLVRQSMLELSDAALPVRWLQTFGFSRNAAEAQVVRFGPASLLPPLGLAEQPSVLAHMFELETVDRQRVTLVQIDQERRAREHQRGKLLSVAPRVPTASEPLAVLLLRCTTEERRLLAAVFGEDAIVDDTTNYETHVARQAFERKPIVQPSRPDRSTWVVSVEHQGVRGLLGVDASELQNVRPKGSKQTEGAPLTAAIDVIYRQRSLTSMRVPCFLPGVRASFAWDEAPVSVTFNGLSGSTTPLSHAVQVGLIALIRQHVAPALQLGGRPGGELRALVWRALVAPFLSPDHYAAWRWFRREHLDDPSRAIEAFWQVFLLFPTYEVAEIADAISMLLAANHPPSRDALIDLLGQGKDWTSPGGATKAKPSDDPRLFHRGLIELYPELEALALFESAGRAPITLTALAESVASTGKLYYIEDQTLSYPGNERLIVRASADDQVGLIRLFGELLIDASDWIREQEQRRAFDAQRALERLEIDPGVRMIAVDFDADGFRGQMAIPPWIPGDSGVMSVLLCHGRRPIETIELHAVLPVQVIVDDERIEFEQQFIRVDRSGKRMAELRSFLGRVLDSQLLPALAERYAGLDPANRKLAWGWVTRWLRKQAPHAGDHPNRLGEVGRRFAELPAFVDIDGSPRTLAELSERYRQHKVLYYLDRKPTDDVPLPERVVLRRAEDHSLLGELFRELRDYEPLRAEVAVGLRRLRNAAPAPSLDSIPVDALVRVDLDRHDLSGALWIPAAYPFDASVVMAAQQRVVEVLPSFVPELPIAGLVMGSPTNRAFSQVELEGAQRRYLEDRVINAYSQVLNRYRYELEHPDRVDVSDVELARRRAVVIELLRAAMIALARSKRAGGPEDLVKGNLRQRLADTPLLRLSTGRLISLTTALESRPVELAHLDLWELPPPAVEPVEPAEPVVSSELEAQIEQLERRVGEGEDALLAVMKLAFARDERAKPAPPETAELIAKGERLDEHAFDVHEQIEVMLQAQRAAAAEPEPPPVTPPPPPEPDPEDLLLDAIREELRQIRHGHEALLSEGLLDKIEVESRRGKAALVRIDGAVIFDADHPCFARALAEPGDPVWVSFLTSVAYSALNHWQAQITDDDELAFHDRHAALLLSGVLMASDAAASL